MVQLSPITEYHSGAGYEYEDNVIYGFTHTNKGHWNLCHIPLLPVSTSDNSATKFSSHFSHQKEKASPAYYEVYLDDYNVKVGLTSTLRCGYHRYEYKDKKNRKILFDLAKSNERVGDWHIEQVSANIIQGYQQTGGKIHFYAILNVPVKSLDIKEHGEKNGYAIATVGESKGPVEVKIGLSFVSVQNAKQNLETEIGNKSFDVIRNEGNKIWEEMLSRIDVKGGSEKDKVMFYSCFYRSLLWPALRSDVNGEFTDAKHNVIKTDFRYYTEPSLWDTYRNKDVFLAEYFLPT